MERKSVRVTELFNYFEEKYEGQKYTGHLLLAKYIAFLDEFEATDIVITDGYYIQKERYMINLLLSHTLLLRGGVVDVMGTILVQIPPLEMKNVMI